MKRKNIRILAVALLIAGLTIFIFGTFGESLLTEEIKITHSYIGKKAPYLYYADLDLSSSNYKPLVIKPAWDEIDQECYVEGDTAGFAVHYSPNWGGCNFIAEGLYNDREPLTGFQLLVSWWDGNGKGTIDDYLYIGISKTLSYNPDDWLMYGALDYSQLQPRTAYWVGMDLSDNPLDISAGETFYIIAVSTDSLPDDLDDGGWWSVGGNYTTDVYSRGHLYYDNNADNNWDEMSNGDLYFRTYTPTSSLKPSISITSSYWVIITQIIGLSMCLASVVLIVRYW